MMHIGRLSASNGKGVGLCIRWNWPGTKSAHFLGGEYEQGNLVVGGQLASRAS